MYCNCVLRYFSFIARIMGYTKPFTHLHPPLAISTDPPPTSTNLPMTFTCLHPPPPTFQSLLLTSNHLHSPLSTTIHFRVFVNLFSFISYLLYFFLEASFTKITKHLQNRKALDSFTHLCIFVSHHIFKQQFVK